MKTIENVYATLLQERDKAKLQLDDIRNSTIYETSNYIDMKGEARLAGMVEAFTSMLTYIKLVQQHEETCAVMVTFH